MWSLGFDVTNLIIADVKTVVFQASNIIISVDFVFLPWYF